MTDLLNGAEYCCNVCGSRNVRPSQGLEREGSSCSNCASSVRLRGLALLVARELTGTSLPLPDLPELRSLRGLGMSDLDCFSGPLSRKFSYINTYYHQPPLFDVTRPDPSQFGQFDFITSSEILEHVPPPVENSFQNLANLLKPGGLLLFTVPYGTHHPGHEHFPSLHKSAIVDLDGKWVLVNRKKDGSIETFEDLTFHGGDGSTLEMRVFTEARLRDLLAGAGFTEVLIAGEPFMPFGIEYQDPWSLPIAARKGSGGGLGACAPELALRYTETFTKLAAKQAELNALQSEYSTHVRWSEEKVAELERESAGRLVHANRIEQEFEERTAWAMQLKSELAETQAEAESLRAEAGESAVKLAAAETALQTASAELEQTNAHPLMRILKKLGIIRVRPD